MSETVLSKLPAFMTFEGERGKEEEMHLSSIMEALETVTHSIVVSSGKPPRYTDCTKRHIWQRKVGRARRAVPRRQRRVHGHTASQPSRLLQNAPGEIVIGENEIKQTLASASSQRMTSRRLLTGDVPRRSCVRKPTLIDEEQ